MFIVVSDQEVRCICGTPRGDDAKADTSVCPDGRAMVIKKQSIEKDADGRFFIDQPAHLFMPLVDFRYEPYDDPNPKLNRNLTPTPTLNP